MLRRGSVLGLVAVAAAALAEPSGDALHAPAGAPDLDGAYEVLPVRPDDAALADGLDPGEFRLFQEGEVLVIVHRSPREEVRLSGSLLVPLQPVPGTDVRVLRLARPSWEEVFFSFGPVGADADAERSQEFRGAGAPPAPAEAERLRGRVLEQSLHSAALQEERDVTVYLPPTRSTHPLPVLVMTDGASCEDFARVVEPLILAGRVRPFALVAVHGGLSSGGQPHVRFLAEEVLPWATHRFGLSAAREDRALFGFGNGVPLALRTALHHAELFAHVLAFSSAVDDFDAPAAAPGAVQASLPRFHFAAGRLEPAAARATRHLAERLRGRGSSAELKIYLSGHEPLMWKLALAEFLPEIFPPASH